MVHSKLFAFSFPDREKNLLDAFFKKLEKVIDAKYQDVDSQLRSDFHHFDPTHRTSQTASTYLSKEGETIHSNNL